MDDELTQARQALASDDYRVQIRAIDVVVQRHDSDAVPALISLLKSKESPVRSAATSALAKLGDTRVIEPLIARLDDSNQHVRENAIEALASLDHPAAREAVLRTLRTDSSWVVRLAIVKAIAHRTDSAPVEALIGALQDVDDGVRGAAAIAVGNLGDPRALSSLQYMAANDNGEHWWPEKEDACSVAGTAEDAIETILARQNGDKEATVLNRPPRQRHRMPDYADCRKAFVLHSIRAKAESEPFPDEDAPGGFVDRIEIRFYRREGRYRVALGTITVDWFRQWPSSSRVIEDPVPRIQEIPWEAWGGLAQCADLLQRLDRSNAPAMQPDEFAALLIESGFEDESAGVKHIPAAGWATWFSLRGPVNEISPPELPGGFPRRLVLAAQDLRYYHVAGLAWPYPTILEVIRELAEGGYAILGGDVWQPGKNGLTLAYDNWYIDHEDDWSWEQYVEASGRKAVEYVEWYHGKFGDRFWYSPTYSPTMPADPRQEG